jgi:three-Cys-motif partner protein
MSGLSSPLAPVQLPAERLPAYQAHHRAKHELLRRYMDVWFPKLGFSYPQVALVDGFASTGRYRDGQHGSPLVMLKAYVERSAEDRARFEHPPHFIFIESKRSFAQHLRAEIDALGDIGGAQVDVIHGRYEEYFPSVVEHLARTYVSPLPVFAFVDPLGYKETPFELIRRYRRKLGAKAEAMIYLPVNFMARFAMTDLAENALQRALGGTDAIERIRANPDTVDRQTGDRIADEFRHLMHREYNYVTQFAVDPVHHNEYHLFFGTGSEHGVRAMKHAYWKVDPVSGSGYQQDPQLALGQGSLFSASDVMQLGREDTLPELLRKHYGSTKFDIADAERWTLLHTRFLDKPHLRQWALRPLERDEEIEIVKSSRSQKGTYPSGTTMRFTQEP